MRLGSNASGPQVGSAQNLNGQPEVGVIHGGQTSGRTVRANRQSPPALVPRADRVQDVKNDVAGAGVAAFRHGNADVDQTKPQRVEGLDADCPRTAGPPQQGTVSPATADRDR